MAAPSGGGVWRCGRGGRRKQSDAETEATPLLNVFFFYFEIMLCRVGGVVAHGKQAGARQHGLAHGKVLVARQRLCRAILARHTAA
jgi:hypothetical protein